ncbi:MAG: hypothetical protein HKN12_07390 [Gemmatimonadetes bacterium]|nr:hypothetical protein [Gemmatimonadota bacterium]
MSDGEARGTARGARDAPSRFGPRTRMTAAIVVTAFLAVSLATTIVSVGRYCLTSHGGDTRGLPEERP